MLTYANVLPWIRCPDNAWSVLVRQPLGKGVKLQQLPSPSGHWMPHSWQNLKMKHQSRNSFGSPLNISGVPSMRVSNHTRDGHRALCSACISDICLPWSCSRPYDSLQYAAVACSDRPFSMFFLDYQREVSIQFQIFQDMDILCIGFIIDGSHTSWS